MNYNFQNTQLYSECQLIAIWNAARFYGMEKKVPKIGTVEYDKICEKFACKTGSCIGVEKELNRLGLKYIQGKWDFRWIKNNLPVKLTIFRPKQGLHSILAIQEEINGFYLANMGDGKLQWCSYEVLQKMKISNSFFRPTAIKKKINFITFLKKLRIIK